MFITLFTTAKTWKQPKCLSIDEWIKMRYIYTMEYCCCCSVMQSSLTFCDYMGCSTPDLPVPRNLPKFMFIASGTPSSHFILWRPLLFLPSIFPSITDFSNESSVPSGDQNTGASASASVLPMNIQEEFPLGLAGLISLQSKGFSRVFSNTTVQKHQFFSAQLSLWSNFHIHIWLLEKP